MLDLKEENRNRVFNAIREEGNISGSELSYKLQLSRPTITLNLNELKEEGLIYECGSLGHTGGRRAKAYAVNEKGKIAIGMDITRNHITIIVADLLEQGEKITLKQWKAEIQSLQSEYANISRDKSKTATELAYAEVISYNKKNLERELQNESRRHNRQQSKAKRGRNLI